MRRIINSTYVSLDGVIENPHLWPSIGPGDDRATALQTELLASCDAMLMGRHTYDGFAPVWPTRSGDPYSDRINSMSKYVVSSTLSDPEWNNTTVISDDVVGEIKQLKEQPGMDILQYGFGRLSHTMLENGLLDEVRLWIYPQFVGNARPQDLVFREGTSAIFDVTDSVVLSNGIVVLNYQLR